jgi:plastocyanin
MCPYRRDSAPLSTPYTGTVPPARLLAALLLAPALGPSPKAETGCIAGTVVLSHALAARREPRFRIYADIGKGATPPSTPASDLKNEYANVVVYLELDRAKILAGPNNPRAPKPVMAQRGEQFVPHVLPILQGTTVEFPNEDDVFHNIFSLSGTRTFDLPKYPAGSSRSVTFPKAGVVNVFCHIHSDMSAVIFVRDNPYFITPDTTGAYSLEDIPPGDYTVVAWHERIKPIATHVKIVAGQTTPVSFDIPLPPPSESHSTPQ